MKYITLNNGVTMPQVGLGVYKIGNDEVTDVVSHALKAGYRSIDTAQYYENEEGVGLALKKSEIPREELFITTKVWNSHHGYDKTMEAFEESMKKLDLDYLDLYLIHWPTPMYDQYVETYKAMENLYKEGCIKAIGVSNFNKEHIERLLDECEVKPVLNQIECHPYFQRKDLKDYCHENQIYIESWSPLARGGVLDDPTINSLAEGYKKTPSQIILRWHIQEESIIIPKSVTPSRIEENVQLFDFELSDKDMKQIEVLERGMRNGGDPATMDQR